MLQRPLIQAQPGNRRDRARLDNDAGQPEDHQESVPAAAAEPASRSDLTAMQLVFVNRVYLDERNIQVTARECQKSRLTNV
jgi:hypothetical protein